MISQLLEKVPDKIRATGMIRMFGLTKVPMIFFLRPSVVAMDEEQIELKIPLTRRSKNHLNSMYFGALSVGADLCGGLVAMDEIIKSKRNISLSFADFNATFHKRAMGDVHFYCKQSKEVKTFVERVIESGERQNMKMLIEAKCPAIDDEAVASFVLTLSLKEKVKRG